MLHWGTGSYAEHKALGKAYETLDGLVDTFMETWMGIHGKELGPVRLELNPYKPGSAERLLDQAVQFFTTELDSKVRGNTDLANLRDELLGVINHTKYLLTLK
jgi:hypothetical protein